MNRTCTKVMTTLKFYNNESNLSMERIQCTVLCSEFYGMCTENNHE